MKLTVCGAAGEVTGSCHLLEVNGSRVLLDCGMIQGRPRDEARNEAPFPFDPASIDAVVLSHAHIDHSGRLPLLVARGFDGPVFTQDASLDLCEIMLRDSAHLSEKDAEWQNRKRERKHLPPVAPLYTVQDAERCLKRLRGVGYGQTVEAAPGIAFRLFDAGHILGSAIVEVTLRSGSRERVLVYSGDLGHDGAPVLRDVSTLERADLVLLESTYGDRLHRSREATRQELQSVLASAEAERGNILIPAFAVGRTQELLYLFRTHYREWGLDRWRVFLDSPMAIEATEVYLRHSRLFDERTRALWAGTHDPEAMLPGLHLTRTAEESMALNNVRSGAIIIAGSGMCTGGRIRHHLKHNVWRRHCHVLMVGFQAAGTVGRQLVDGRRQISLWGEAIRVGALVHTIGGLSAHADQNGLATWYGHFRASPTVVLVHGEQSAREALRERLRHQFACPVTLPAPGQQIPLD